MDQLLKKMLKDAEKNKHTVIAAKNLAAQCGHYELAAHFRNIERKKFPDTKEQIWAKKVGKELNLLFRMVDLEIPDQACWLIYQTLKKFQKKKGKFTIHDAAKLQVEQKELFPKN